VTLVDNREDYGGFTKEELSKNHRSWMLGLADHGMDAIKTLPALYENFVKGEGILVRDFNIYFGSKKFTQSVEDDKDTGGPPENFIVDRNFVVAALARYLRETHADDPSYTAMYETKCMYVDYENKRVLVRGADATKDEYIDYDLLVGCDGVRSIVREALVKRHSDFSLDYQDIFQEFKAVHLKRPESISPTGMSILPEIFPCCQGIVLPETGDQINISIGAARNNFESVDEELKSDDYKVVSEYLKKKFKAFELVDYDHFAKQWVGQRWNQTGMVHCNFYHSIKTGVVIMGDAAHATSPSIGMGMNTALRDTQIFSEILAETNDNFDEALPAFSKARVKEGNSLSDLAMHLFCIDQAQQFWETIHQVVRSFFSSRFPGWVDEHPALMIGRRGVSLSECYDRGVKLGIINKHRVINNRIRTEYFEQQTGMVQSPTKGISTLSKMVLGAGVAAVAACAYQQLG